MNIKVSLLTLGIYIYISCSDTLQPADITWSTFVFANGLLHGCDRVGILIHFVRLIMNVSLFRNYIFKKGISYLVVKYRHCQ